MRTIYRGMLTLNSPLLFVVIYLIKEQRWIPYIKVYSAGLYALLLIIFSLVCLNVSGKLSRDSIDTDPEGVEEIELETDTYLSVYLGYFFVALSIPQNDFVTFGVVVIILFIFTFFSQVQYFNPIFLLFRYRFYALRRQGKTKIMIITKRLIKDIKCQQFHKLTCCANLF